MDVMEIKQDFKTFAGLLVKNGVLCAQEML